MRLSMDMSPEGEVAYKAVVEEIAMASDAVEHERQMMRPTNG